MSADTRSVASLLDELRFNGRAHFTQNFRHALADLIAEAITADYDRIRALHDAEIVRLRGEVEFHQLDAGALRVQLDSCIERLEVQTKNALHLHAMMVDAEARAATLAPAEAKGDLSSRMYRGLSHPDTERANLLDRRSIAEESPQPADGGAVAYLIDGRIEQALSFDKSAAETMAFANSGTVRPLYAHPPAAQVHGEAVTWSGDERAAIAELMKAQGLSESSLLRQSLRLYQSDWQRRRNGETCVWSGDEKRARDFAGPITNPAGDALGVVRGATIESFCDAMDSVHGYRPRLWNRTPMNSRDFDRYEGWLLALQHRGDSRGGEG